MREEQGPSINLKNINYINIAEKKPSLGSKKLSVNQQISTNLTPLKTVTISQIAKILEEDKPIFEKEYFEKHVYMMKEKMLEMFKNSGDIPLDDKKTIEGEFTTEFKELKKMLKEIKKMRSQLFADNNELHNRIERINDEIQKEDSAVKKKLNDQKRHLENRYGGGSSHANKAIMNFMMDKEKAKRCKDEKTKIKNEIKNLWDRNNEDIRILEEKLSLVKSKIEFIKSVLKEYYINLLKQGTDTRYFNIFANIYK